MDLKDSYSAKKKKDQKKPESDSDRTKKRPRDSALDKVRCCTYRRPFNTDPLSIGRRVPEKARSQDFDPRLFENSAGRRLGIHHKEFKGILSTIFTNMFNLSAAGSFAQRKGHRV